jgi:glutaminyl-peptide cyclotransferase
MALFAAGWSLSSGACHRTRPEVVAQTYDAGHAETTSKAPSLDGGTEQPVRKYMASPTRTISHERDAFTEGLVARGSVVYESTGLYGSSSLRKLELATGKVLARKSLGREYFGEGLTELRGKLYQLSWKEDVCFVYDAESLAEIRRFNYAGEGWGLTNDEHYLIMSDGSDKLYFRDPDNFSIVRQIDVTAAGHPVYRINELEYANGVLYANIWQTSTIAEISPASGHVTAWIDISMLLTKEDLAQHVDVANGIAYDESSKRLIVTGKLWPKMFEVSLVPVEERAPQ